MNQKTNVLSNFKFNPLSTNFTKWSNTLKQFVGKLPTNCLSVFANFVRLAFKVLRKITEMSFFIDTPFPLKLLNTFSTAFCNGLYHIPWHLPRIYTSKIEFFSEIADLAYYWWHTRFFDFDRTHLKIWILKLSKGVIHLVRTQNSPKN